MILGGASPAFGGGGKGGVDFWKPYCAEVGGGGDDMVWGTAFGNGEPTG